MFAANNLFTGWKTSSIYSVKCKLARICINVSIKPVENRCRYISLLFFLSACLLRLTGAAEVSRSDVKFVNRSFSLSPDTKLQLGVIEQRSCLSGGKERAEESDMPISVDE